LLLFRETAFGFDGWIRHLDDCQAEVFSDIHQGLVETLHGRVMVNCPDLVFISSPRRKIYRAGFEKGNF